MGLIRYSCSHISGPHESIHVKVFVWSFFCHVLLKYGHENAEMQNWKFDDVTLQDSIKGNYTKNWAWFVYYLKLIIKASCSKLSKKLKNWIKILVCQAVLDQCFACFDQYLKLLCAQGCSLLALYICSWLVLVEKVLGGC